MGIPSYKILPTTQTFYQTRFLRPQLQNMYQVYTSIIKLGRTLYPFISTH